MTRPTPAAGEWIGLVMEEIATDHDWAGPPAVWLLHATDDGDTPPGQQHLAAITVPARVWDDGDAADGLQGLAAAVELGLPPGLGGSILAWLVAYRGPFPVRMVVAYDRDGIGHVRQDGDPPEDGPGPAPGRDLLDRVLAALRTLMNLTTAEEPEDPANDTGS